MEAPEHKHLGVILTSDLKWTAHINYCTSKSLKKLGLLRRQSGNLSRSQKETVYTGVIRPTLEYGSVLYHNCSASDAARLETVQRKAALICTGAIRRTETRKLMLELN